jgi:superfamily I DNA/RNA helicase
MEVEGDHTYIGDDIATHNCNPVILSVVTGQRQSQLIAVGDRSQAIYGWRGAVDAMDRFPGADRLTLSQSFRFGPMIATEANKWLAVAEASLRITGYDRISSMVAPLPDAHAVLCRSNAETVARAMAAADSGKKAAIVGGGDDIRRLAEAAITLKAGIGTTHPELMAFQNWAEVQDHAENDPSGSDLKVLVGLIDKHGADVIISVVDSLVEERRADTVISTAHKAKGREWNSVKIADDFREPKGEEDGAGGTRPGKVQREEAMLAYVAVTRARLTLDRSGLAWVDRYLPGLMSA